MLRLKTLVGEHPRGEGLFSRQSAIPGSGCTWQVKGASGLGTCTPLRKPGPLTSAVAACSREGQGRTCEKQAQAGSGHRTPSHFGTAGTRARGGTPLGHRSGFAAGLARLCWFQGLSSAVFYPQTNCDGLGTLRLRSPVLIIRGISSRPMFFTVDTARAGAAERPSSDFSSLF